MRQSQKSSRSRSRGRKPSNPLTRSYDSNGPDVKIRGTANHIAEKYQSLARDALASGDIVMAENYYQHAEHYLRIIAAAQTPNRDQDGRHNASNDEVVSGDSNGRHGANGNGDDEESAVSDNESKSIASEMDVMVLEGVPAERGKSEAGKTDNDASDASDGDAPAPRRRRRTTYRPRKRTATSANGADGGEGMQPNPVSAPDAPQPVISDD